MIGQRVLHDSEGTEETVLRISRNTIASDALIAQKAEEMRVPLVPRKIL